MFLGASVALTGSMQLAATDAERRDIGGALSDALSFFEESSPFVKLLNVMGPWSGVIDGLATAVYNRVVYISQHRTGAFPPPPSQARTTTTIAGGINGRAHLEDEILAPDPASGFNG